MKEAVLATASPMLLVQSFERSPETLVWNKTAKCADGVLEMPMPKSAQGKVHCLIGLCNAANQFATNVYISCGLFVTGEQETYYRSINMAMVYMQNEPCR